MKIENGPATSVSLGTPPLTAGAQYFNYVGSIMGLGPFVYGTLIPTDTIATLGSGQRLVINKPVSLAGLTTAGETLVPWPANMNYNNYKATCQVQGTNYNAYVSEDMIFADIVGGYYTLNVGNQVQNNTAGYGNLQCIVRTANAGISLLATSGSFAAGMNYYITLTQIGQGPSNHFSQ